MKNFTDKVVVITGAGSGIGQALAVDLAGRGALLAISDIDESGLAQTAERARRAGARDVRTDRLDVADRAAFEAYANEIAAHFGRVNVVINNAGVSLAGELMELAWDDIDWLLGINFYGVLHGTKFFLPHLVDSGEGHLVNISSLFGLISMATQSIYNASKFAVRGLSEAVRQEMLMGGHQVGVTVVHPGGIKTGIARSGRAGDPKEQAAFAKFFDERLARTSAEKAAQVIIRGIERDQARVLVGLDAHAIHNFGKFAGARYQDVLAFGASKVLPKRLRP